MAPCAHHQHPLDQDHSLDARDTRWTGLSATHPDTHRLQAVTCQPSSMTPKVSGPRDQDCQNIVHDAAGIVLTRSSGNDNEVLIGRRSGRARFMPGRYVFPGGRLEDSDLDRHASMRLSSRCIDALGYMACKELSVALLNCAIREFEEETGIAIKGAIHGPCPTALDGPTKTTKADSRNLPAARFICRAITPPGYARRYDARFFLITADRVQFEGDTEGFSGASGELQDLRWATIPEALSRNTAFITRTILINLAIDIQGSQKHLPARFHFVRNGMARVVDIHPELQSAQ